jgi:hypothetical protein
MKRLRHISDDTVVTVFGWFLGVASIVFALAMLWMRLENQ